MRGDEERVTIAFCSWLERHGWAVQREVGFIDVSAQRGEERLHAEVKGRTSSPGLDVDTMFGQLLRRMTDPTARYAVVVPEGRALTAVLRVPAPVLERLGINVYAVTDDGSVNKVR
ncbi:MAG TPA: hypothetical protein VFH76_03910 [Kribbella sp.]|nr:hypothetical protein [Kribbella sp.]